MSSALFLAVFTCLNTRKSFACSHDFHSYLLLLLLPVAGQSPERRHRVEPPFVRADDRRQHKSKCPASGTFQLSLAPIERQQQQRRLDRNLVSVSLIWTPGRVSQPVGPLFVTLRRRRSTPTVVLLLLARAFCGRLRLSSNEIQPVDGR